MVNEDSSTPNITISDQNDTDRPVFNRLVSAVNYWALLTGLIIVVMETIAVIILRKCRRIPVRSRYLSASFILSDLIGALVFVIHQVVMFGAGYNTDLGHISRTITVGALLTVSWASVAAMALDRLMAIKYNMKYKFWTRKADILTSIAFLWALNLVTIFLFFITGVKRASCSIDLSGCNLWDASRAARHAMMAMLIFYLILVVVSYTYIYRIASIHAQNIKALKVAACNERQKYPENFSSRQINRTRAVLKIVLAFVVLHAPIIIKLWLFESEIITRHQTVGAAFNAFSYFCIQINSFVTISIYAGNFKEMKLHFYFLLSKMCWRYYEKAEKLRVDIYNIVIYSGQDRPSNSDPVSQMTVT